MALFPDTLLRQVDLLCADRLIDLVGHRRYGLTGEEVEPVERGGGSLA